MSELATLMGAAKGSEHIGFYDLTYINSQDTIRLRATESLLIDWGLPEDTTIDILVKIRGTNRKITVVIDGEKVPYKFAFRPWLPEEKFFKQQGWRENMATHLLDVMRDVHDMARYIVEVTKTGTHSSHPNPNGEQR